MESSIPEVSSVAWSSIITGKNPAEHGIFGFTDLRPNTYELRFPNYRHLEAPPFWDELGGKSVVVNVPSTYPVREMNGVHISGFVSIDITKSVYPATLVPILQKLDYRLDVDSNLAHSSMDSFLVDLDTTLTARIETYRYLWDAYDWQLFMFVFTGTDRLMHFLWEAYEDQNHRYHGQFLEHFRKIDEVIGDINEKIDSTDLFLMLSDHGFERLDLEVYINNVLQREGFLQMERVGEPDLAHITSSTQAFALDPARIYCNVAGVYPKGSVGLNDRDRVLEDLTALFESFSLDGRQVIKRVYRKEDLYRGPLLDRAPDLVLVGNEGFNLKSSLRGNTVAEKGIFTGKHTQDDAFLLVRDPGDGVVVQENTAVFDIRTIILG
jgi:predicted AlkP superfamily phosphohydrolase/phosphomutase